jgi:hypothetical protein
MFIKTIKMKEKSLLAYSALLFTVLVAFTACRKTNNSNSSVLVGTWEAISAQDILTDSSTNPFTVINFDTTYIHGHSPLVVQFNNDNTYINTDHSVNPDTVIETGTYQLIAGSKILRMGGGTSDTVSYTISNNSLTIQGLQHSQGQSDFGTTEFTKQ